MSIAQQVLPGLQLHEENDGCYLKPLTFGVVCHTAARNWDSYSAEEEADSHPK